ncbi:hypothetical protein ACHHYP_06991 [Achlya hypogyna]|uniref:Uncharacterized protein n=1 Tax=Achlya hypogyna TaxID=1202772 RepID=A0A1V9YR79_ACHHY|nr:hypothetical protein ACHHYP_06991 [Achlya hypogyna]
MASRLREKAAEKPPIRGYCLYKTGKCHEERALKSNGRPHNLCNFHRMKQNQNQRRLDCKVRAQQMERNAAATSPARSVLPALPTWPPTPREVYRTQVIRQLVRLVSEEVLEARLPPLRSPMTDTFRGHCLYKTGKCKNERALKTNGQAHNLCDEHRAKQNQNQRKMDSKMRQKRHFSPYESPQAPSDDHAYYPPQAYAYAPPMPYGSYYEPMRYPPMPDVGDQITVPTPAYLKGEAREAFRSRVLQKLVNIISEEVTAIPPPAYMASPPPYAPEIELPRLPSLASRISRQHMPSPKDDAYPL